MDSITDQINQLKAKIQLNASKEAILDYYNESSQQEANVKWKALIKNWDYDHLPELTRTTYYPWIDVIASMYAKPETIETDDHCCKKCNQPLIVFDFSSPAWTWAKLCGRGGYMWICPHCVYQESFKQTIMN